MTHLINLAELSAIETLLKETYGKDRYRSSSPEKGTQYEAEFDPEYGVLWAFLNPRGNQCYTTSLLEDIKKFDDALQANQHRYHYCGQKLAVNYYVLGSRASNVFSFGGDLALFTKMIRNGDRDSLACYARLCIDALYTKINNFSSDTMTTITLLKGDALGGGMETALSSDIIIAEEHTKMGLPEILFNLFPGMGAYSLLARRIGQREAEKLISSGDILSAQAMYDLGVVDIVAPTGMGEQYVYNYIQQNERRRNGLQAIYKTRNAVNPITYQELMTITELWVDAALRLEEKDLKMMSRLVRAQTKRLGLA